MPLFSNISPIHFLKSLVRSSDQYASELLARNMTQNIVTELKKIFLLLFICLFINFFE